MKTKQLMRSLVTIVRLNVQYVQAFLHIILELIQAWSVFLQIDIASIFKGLQQTLEEVGSNGIYTIIRFFSDSAKFCICTMDLKNLLQLKYAHSSVPSVNFSFKQCTIYTHDNANTKFSSKLRRNGLQCSSRCSQKVKQI